MQEVRKPDPAGTASAESPGRLSPPAGTAPLRTTFNRPPSSSGLPTPAGAVAGTKSPRSILAVLKNLANFRTIALIVCGLITLELFYDTIKVSDFEVFAGEEQHIVHKPGALVDGSGDRTSFAPVITTSQTSECAAQKDCDCSSSNGEGKEEATKAASASSPSPPSSKAAATDSADSFDFKVPFLDPKEAAEPPQELRLASSKCPKDKPLCETRVALLMTGHVRGALEGNRLDSVRGFLGKCREEAKTCDLFIHTWRYEKFLTRTWNTAVPSLGKETDMNFFCRELNCTGITVERQYLNNINSAREWGKGGVSYEGSMMVPYALYVANMNRRAHNARFGTAHDVTIRIRPDYYRTAHGDVMPPANFRRCISGIKPDTIYGIGRYVPGGNFPRNLLPNGQIRRPWEGNSGDNFYFTRSDVFDRFIDYWMHHFPDVQKDTIKWNVLNPEADVGTVLQRLNIKATVCA